MAKLTHQLLKSWRQLHQTYPHHQAPPPPPPPRHHHHRHHHHHRPLPHNHHHHRSPADGSPTEGGGINYQTHQLTGEPGGIINNDKDYDDDD